MVTIVQPDAGLIVSGELPVLSVREPLPDEVRYCCPSGHEVDPFLAIRRCPRCDLPARPLTVLLHARGYLPLEAPPWAPPAVMSELPVGEPADVVLARLTLTSSHHPDYCPSAPGVETSVHGARCHRLARPGHWHHTIGGVIPLREPVPLAQVVDCPVASGTIGHAAHEVACPCCGSDPGVWWWTDREVPA